jgi:DNA repair protein RadC
MLSCRGFYIAGRARAYHTILAVNCLSRQKRLAPRRRVPAICFHGAIERSAVVCRLSPAGNCAGYKEKIMTRRSLAKSLAVRSDRGYVVTPAEAFSSGFLKQTPNGLTPVSDTAVIQAALSILANKVTKGSVLASPQAVRQFLIARLSDAQHEIFSILLLDKRHRLIDFVEISRGTIDGASVWPREICKLVLARNAAACIISHQHPSGIAEPSPSDELITTRLKEALALIDVRLLDHILCAGGTSISFAERGLL